MTWIYTPNSVSSPGTPGLRSGSGSPASMPAPSATSNKTPTVSPSYKPTYETGTSMTPPFGTTSEPLTDDRGEEPTSLLLGSPVSHTVQQARERALVTTEISGPIHSGSLAKWSPDTSCWRTYQASMWAMLDGQLMGEPWLGNFPNWGTMRNGELIPLSKPEPLITEEDGGSWATPTVNNSKNNAGPSQMDRHGPALDVQVAHYPTPLSSDAIGSRSSKGADRPDEGGLLHAVNRMLPTPHSSMSTGPGRQGREGGDNLQTAVDGSLNPDWVSWLMGLPVGWASLEPLAQEDYDDWLQAQFDGTWWLEERGLPRVATGIKNRVSRLKMLGNGIVPGTAALAIQELSARLL